MSLYNNLIQERFHSHEPPVKGLKAVIAEYDQGYLALRMYRSNFDSYTEPQRKAIVLWANTVLEDLSRLVPISLEIFK